MGTDVAQLFATNGFEIILYDFSEAALLNGKAKIEKSYAKLVEKGKLDASEADSAKARLKYTANINDCAAAELIIEAVIENAQIKKDIFKRLDALCSQKAIFASNTSSISITEIGNSTARPDKFIGMHFFNPAGIMKLIEIIRGLATSDETFNTVKELSIKIGKEPVEVKDSPGFVVNKILVPMINESIGVLSEGVASAADIDKAMMLGANHPIGPLALSDLIGNDTVLNIMDVLFDETKDSKYRASPYLRKMVRGGLLGKKSGKGFFDYAIK